MMGLSLIPGPPQRTNPLMLFMLSPVDKKGAEKRNNFLSLDYSFFSSSAFSSASISSRGLGGGVVAIVQPIQAPMNSTTRNAMSTGTATSQS